jgi:hypothetical protein
VKRDLDLITPEEEEEGVDEQGQPSHGTGELKDISYLYKVRGSC